MLPRIFGLLCAIFFSIPMILFYYVYHYHRESVHPFTILFIISSIASFSFLIIGLVLGTKWEDDVRNLRSSKIKYSYFILNVIILVCGIIFFEIFWYTFGIFVYVTIFDIFYFSFYEPHLRNTMTDRQKKISGILFVLALSIFSIIYFIIKLYI